VVAQGGGEGGREVSKEIKYADRAVYFPWRPRWALRSPKMLWVHKLATGWAACCFLQRPKILQAI
jgi:hypothetical protein